MLNQRKASNEQIAESYSRLKSVWAVGSEFGMCGQSVHERCIKLGIIESNKSQKWQLDFIKMHYEYYANRQRLSELSEIVDIEKSNLVRTAKKLNIITQKSRKLLNSNTSKLLYHIYHGICARCENPKSESYKHYGGRGIKNLFTGLDQFTELMAAGYKKGLSIDRIDVNGHYEPCNVRWASNTTQSRNRRNNRYAVINGIKVLLIEYCEANGLNYNTVNKRITKYKWSEERAVNTPVITQKRYLKK